MPVANQMIACPTSCATGARKRCKIDRRKECLQLREKASLQFKRKTACSKKRKVDCENRAFKEEWTDLFMFILPACSSKPVCLICSETVALVKSSNVKRHYETKHKEFDINYPLKSEVRAQKIKDLKAQYARSTNMLTYSFTAQQRANECSFRVAWILGQNKKAFTDAEVVKECMSAVAETLLEGKQNRTCVRKSSKYLCQHEQPQEGVKHYPRMC